MDCQLQEFSTSNHIYTDQLQHKLHYRLQLQPRHYDYYSIQVLFLTMQNKVHWFIHTYIIIHTPMPIPMPIPSVSHFMCMKSFHA